MRRRNHLTSDQLRKLTYISICIYFKSSQSKGNNMCRGILYEEIVSVSEE